MRSINDVIGALPAPLCPARPAPRYSGNGSGPRLGLAVESMRRHMTDEGWQIFEGLQYAGWELHGHGLPGNRTHVPSLISQNPYGGVILMQDKREWDIQPTRKDFRDRNAGFRNVEVLKDRSNWFKLTIIKDAHQRPSYHRQSADEIGCHAWVTYYHPRIVCHLAPYVRPQHLVRTYHTINADVVPSYNPKNRKGCLLCGAVSAAYPLRKRLIAERASLSYTVYKEHPGYHRNGCETPTFISQLSGYKAVICTASVYGYALRKLVEATAAGCIVITDLPHDDPLPYIDGNLIRIPSSITTREIDQVIRSAVEHYNPEAQEHYAQQAKQWYDYRTECSRLAEAIETMRRNYCVSSRQHQVAQ